jgi:Ser/Thr protein kinase RdoA (MazF antagonist)
VAPPNARSVQAARPAAGGLFPVTHSVLAAEALVREVLPAYDIGSVRDCRLHLRHLSDTYFVDTREPGGRGGRSGTRYVLRVYRTGWRSDAAIRYELDVLNHLAAAGLSVSTPIVPRDGDPLRIVHAPEGRRQLVLFTFARGSEEASSDAHARLYGRAVAATHDATDGFTSPHARHSIDLDELLEAPLRALRPILAARPKERRHVLRLAGRLREAAAALPLERLETGFCHGDFHGGNACIDGDTITFFDFDLCGPGWRAYDVAVFRWGLTGGWLEEAKAEARWAAFQEGYAERRRLAPLDLAAIPFFVLVRQLWFMGLWGANGRDWGYRWPLSNHYLEQAMTLFRTWEPKLAG